MKYLFNKKTIISIILVFSLFVFKPASINAQTVTVTKVPPCESVGQCINNYKCVSHTTNNGSQITTTISLSTEPNCTDSAIGGVKSPTGINFFDNAATANGGNAAGQNIGIIAFISNLLKVFTIIAGAWAMFNFIMGGYTYITSMSDAGATEKVKNSITMTVVGLAIIAAAYTIAGLIGLIMFGDAGFILNPKLEGALQ